MHDGRGHDGRGRAIAIRNPIELRALRCFYVAAEELHFGRAAERLLISQPTLSQQIRQLERQIGVKLFERSTRRVELSVAGAALKQHVKELLAKTDEAVLIAQQAGGGRLDHLSIAAISPATYRFLPLVLRRFCARFPDSSLTVKSKDSHDIVTGLEQDEFHLGLIRPLTNPGILRFTPLLRERFLAAIPARHPLAAKRQLAIRDFVGTSVIPLKRFEITGFETLYNTLLEAGISFREDMVVSNTMGALALISAGVGISFLPEWITDLVTHDIVIRHVEDLDIAIHLCIGWKADNPAPGIEPFIEMARMAAKSLGREAD